MFNAFCCYIQQCWTISVVARCNSVVLPVGARHDNVVLPVGARHDSVVLPVGATPGSIWHFLWLGMAVFCSMLLRDDINSSCC